MKACKKCGEVKPLEAFGIQRGNPLVCGLHVEQNIRVIPMKINRALGNRGWSQDNSI